MTQTQHISDRKEYCDVTIILCNMSHDPDASHQCHNNDNKRIGALIHPARNITTHQPCHSGGICCDVPSQTLTRTRTLSGTQTPTVNPNTNTLPKQVLSYVTSMPIQCSPRSSSFHDICKLKHMPEHQIINTSYITVG
jgi:hypothetical protein